MHKLHLCCSEGIKDNLDLAGSVLGFLLKEDFLTFLRMPSQMFDELLNRVGPRCHKMETHYKKALEPGLKLAITIWHLTSGDKYPTLQYDNTICMLIPKCARQLLKNIKMAWYPVQQKMNGMPLLTSSTGNGMCHMPAVLLTANMLLLDVHLTLAPCFITTRVSSHWSFLLWWMQTKFLWMDSGPCLMLRSTTHHNWRSVWKMKQLDSHIQISWLTMTRTWPTSSWVMTPLDW